MDAASQLDEAVSVALHGSDELKRQALAFVAQVEADPLAWLATSLEIFAGGTKRDATQFFALQVVDRAIKLATDNATLAEIRARLWTRISEDAAGLPRHIRNKLAEPLKSLFVRLYSDTWPTFFADFVGLVDTQPETGELYAQVLMAVHGEIGDTLILRDATEQQRANNLKDLVRDRDIARLADSWRRLLASSPNPAVIDGILQVVAGWASWTDAGLILPCVPHIHKQLANPITQNSATVALSEIVAKKMAPALKLELLQTSQIIEALNTSAVATPEFGESLARVANSVLFEAAHALLELPTADATPIGLGLQQVVSEIFPLVTRFLEDEYDDTSVQLLPGVTEYIAYLRRESRRHNDKASAVIGGNLTPQQTSAVKSLLNSVVAKSKYEPDDYDVDEADSEFVDFRTRLRVIQEQLAQVDTLLFIEVIGEFIASALTQASNANSDPSPENTQHSTQWTALELALYELSIYGDVTRLFVARGSKYGSGVGEIAAKTQQTQFMLFAQMVVAGSRGWEHPANLLWYMELVHRHASVLAGKSDEHRALLGEAFKVFLEHGVRHEDVRVRVKSWYLFYRLVKAVRRSPLMADATVGPKIFETVAGYLPIPLAPTSPNTSDEDETDVFSAQLYLYELCGTVFALSEAPDRSAELMRQLLATMFNNIDAAASSATIPTTGKKDDPAAAAALTMHHNIVALSSLTKGVSETAAESSQSQTSQPDSSSRDSSPDSLASLKTQLKTASQMVVAVLERSHAMPLVRDACRQAFSRLLSFLGETIIIEISSFIDVSLQTTAPPDLADFLSFLGQIAHQFAHHAPVFEMFQSLSVPLFEKVFGVLQAAADAADAESAGTDALIFRREVVAAYLQLLVNLLNNNYGAILFAENPAVLASVYASLLHYATNGDVKGGAGSATNQKQAVLLLTKMTATWGTGEVVAPHFGAGWVVPLFSDPATYERLTELCWTLPASPSCTFTDAQSRMVIQELAVLQQTMYERRGATYQAHLAPYLTSSGLGPGMVEEFVSKLGLAAKEFKRFYVEFLRAALNK